MNYVLCGVLWNGPTYYVLPYMTITLQWHYLQYCNETMVYTMHIHGEYNGNTNMYHNKIVLIIWTLLYSWLVWIAFDIAGHYLKLLDINEHYETLYYKSAMQYI